MTSFWFDPWLGGSAPVDFITNDERKIAGIRREALVADVLQNSVWDLPYPVTESIERVWRKFNDWPDEDSKQEQEPNSAPVSINNADCWELVLFETTNQAGQMQTQASTDNMNGFPKTIMEYLFDQPLTTNYQPPTTTSQHQYNPFLDDMSDFSMNTMPFSDKNALALATTPPNNQQTLALIPTTPPSDQQALALTYHDDNLLLAAPTFQAIKPTFCETITLLNDQQALPLTIPDDNLFLAAPTFQATNQPSLTLLCLKNNQQAQALITATPPSDQQVLALTFPDDNLFSATPTFQASTKSTFSAQSSNEFRFQDQDDLCPARNEHNDTCKIT
ncbi:hypothetical protein ACFE04_005674 [Oxalis oulophora]